MKVLALPRYGPLAPSSRIRCYQYLPALRAAGITVEVSPLLPDEYVRRLYAGRPVGYAAAAGWYWSRVRALLARHRFDLLWIAHELFPSLPATAERWLARVGPRFVLESDDAWFHRYDRSPSRLRRTLLGKKIDVVMARAALVIAGNDYLADRARRAGAGRVAVLPSTVDVDRYRPLPEPDGPFTIGWIGSPTTAEYLDLVSAPLQAEAARGTRLVAIGAPRAPLPGGPWEVRCWDEDREAADIASFHVGIMPLADGPWERGKCGYKLIQYMAGGRPVIASAVGANVAIVEHGVTGFLVNGPDEWAKAFRTLAADPALRQRMGAAGRRLVEERYSVQANAGVLANLLRSAAAPIG